MLSHTGRNIFQADGLSNEDGNSNSWMTRCPVFLSLRTKNNLHIFVFKTFACHLGVITGTCCIDSTLLSHYSLTFKGHVCSTSGEHWKAFCETSPCFFLRNAYDKYHGLASASAFGCKQDALGRAYCPVTKPPMIT